MAPAVAVRRGQPKTPPVLMVTLRAPPGPRTAPGTLHIYTTVPDPAFLPRRPSARSSGSRGGGGDGRIPGPFQTDPRRPIDTGTSAGARAVITPVHGPAVLVAVLLVVFPLRERPRKLVGQVPQPAPAIAAAAW